MREGITMVKKISNVYLCNNCDFRALKWEGKCSGCGEWNSLVQVEESSKQRKLDEQGSRPERVSEVNTQEYSRKVTGIAEFDRVLGGGIVIGSLTLLGGEPGIGKSTLLTEVLAALSKKYPQEDILYVSGEESIHQVADRVKRLGLIHANFYIYNETNWQSILGQIKKIRPSVIVLDSIQTTVSGEVQSAAGSVSQVREVTYELMNHVKGSSMTCFVIGHITKEGSIAGPKILEHMVDTVIYFEGDQLSNNRILRSIKNRFGNTNEVGIFEMNEKGLNQVLNPSQYFIDASNVDAYGRSISCVMEGTRPLFIEVQALVVDGQGRKTTQGIDTNRVSMLVAVIEKYLGIPMNISDIYLNIIGGIKVKGQDTDLSIISSLLSSFKNKKIDTETILIGEVGLNGEVRSVGNIDKRIKEMERLKYKKLITSKNISQRITGKSKLEIIGISKIQEIEEHLNL